VGRDAAGTRAVRCLPISIHAPHVGRDCSSRANKPPLTNFNPRAPRGARRSTAMTAWGYTRISIHAPHVGRDDVVVYVCIQMCDFNPRAPRGARQFTPSQPAAKSLFQSTRPTWGATRMWRRGLRVLLFQSTRPTWGATSCTVFAGGPDYISIHAPHVGRDCLAMLSTAAAWHFNPRAPRGARRPVAYGNGRCRRISIHAPHVGRDGVTRQDISLIEKISIHAPHVGRDLCHKGRNPARQISIHAPHVGRDGCLTPACSSSPISIHAPHVGRDVHWTLNGGTTMDFNPRAPRGARHFASFIGNGVYPISIHAPHVGRDPPAIQRDADVYISIHAPHVGRDTCTNSAWRT